MYNIVLFCSAGMSTSLLVTKMEAAAKAQGIEAKINAYSEAQMAKYVPEADVVLLGPQIRFALARAKKICDEHNVPIDVIAPQDYGMMNGQKVLEKAIALIKK
ncbi:PTS sugar transporter subunit IIB [Clostridium folliculivorans]|uniref:PTS sugar transporter subunit IIB n=1 Tax=Clostridium folliculivorans TaxID=2886038 RepID=A0A9W5Y6Q3_9CLOT|nr:PTS sugar transporter subunit IIB [Clostridium folliculivorans]GKU27656.1 PTS sugar transporter subunit IIB [Clostridium folliculivorans]GKU32419.1 PTS sugar transporter subunit IIB [Clostridium folliculivorans]